MTDGGLFLNTSFRVRTPNGVTDDPQNCHPLPSHLFISGVRCDALGKMQRLSDEALSGEHASLYSASPSPSARVPVPAHPQTVNASSAAGESPADPSLPADRHEPRSLDGGGGDAKDRGQAVSKMLACWRGEVLKLLLQKGVVMEAAAGEIRKATREVKEANEARLKAEMETKV